MREYDFDFQVDGRPLLMPDAGVAVKKQQLLAADSGRDESGFLHRRLLRQDMRQWDFSYGAVTAGEYRYLMSLFEGRGSFLFSFRAEDGQPQTARCYWDGCTASLFDTAQGVYKSLKFSVVEC